MRREPGGPLNPSRLSVAEIEALKARMAPHVFASQYQQRPEVGGTGYCWTVDQFVEPVMSVANRVSEDRARFGSHRRVAHGRSPSPWMISRRRWGDGGVQGMIRMRF